MDRHVELARVGAVDREPVDEFGVRRAAEAIQQGLPCGEQVNPLVMAKSSEAVELSLEARQRFAGVARQIRGQLDAALTIGTTVAE